VPEPAGGVSDVGAEHVAVRLDTKPEMVSFHFGLPKPEVIRALKSAGLFDSVERDDSRGSATARAQGCRRDHRAGHRGRRSIRARGSAVVSCRAPTRRRRDPRSRQSGQPPASAVPRYRPGRGFCGLSPFCRSRNPLGCRYRPLFRRFRRWAVENRSRGGGLAAHPRAQRICSSAQIASQVPSRCNLRKML
jgi:hypothetical protein